MPPGFPPLPVLPPQSYYPPTMHTAPYQGDPSFQQGFPSSGYGQQTRKARCHSPDSNSSHTLIHPGTTVNPSVTSAEASAPGHIPARSGRFQRHAGASALRADSDDTKPVSHGRFLFLFTEYNGHSIDSFPAPYSNQPLKPKQ